MVNLTTVLGYPMNSDQNKYWLSSPKWVNPEQPIDSFPFNYLGYLMMAINIYIFCTSFINETCSTPILFPSKQDILNQLILFCKQSNKLSIKS